MGHLQKKFSKDSVLIVLLLVLGIAGLLLFHLKQDSVFPNASIDLSKGKPEILSKAKEWATRFGYQKQHVIQSIVFDSDDQSKTFLEYELGNAKANSLMRDTIPVFFWQCRFRKAFDQETTDVQVSPTGKLLAVDLQLPNDKKMPSIGHTEAENKAFAFIKEQLNWDEKDCKLTKDETQPKVNRTDHKFTWEFQKIDWKGAKLRADVELSGNMLSGFNYYLKIPEKWERDYSTIRTKNELLESVASVFYFSLYPIGIFIFLRGMSKGEIRLRFSVITGIALAAIFAVEYLNNFPDVLSKYVSNTSYKLFIIGSIVYPLLGVPFLIMLIAALAGAGELVYRKLFPDKIALESILTAFGICSQEVLVGLLVGLASFGLSLGYQIIYYSLGSKLNFWCPLEVGNYQALSAYWPWYSALSLGVFAATNEEILYRVLMLGLTKRIVRNFWIANILQAAAWGFMHSTYPQQPCYARGLELTIEGVFDGWILRRFGLLACLVSHYSFDAFQCVTPLFTAPLRMKLSAFLPFVPILATLFYGLSRHQKHKAQSHDQLPLSNKSIDQRQINQAIPELKDLSPNRDYTYQPLSNKTRWICVGVTIVGLLVQAVFGDQSDRVGGDGQILYVTRTEAIDRARDYLGKLRLDLRDYQIATFLDGNTGENHDQVQYLFEQQGLKRTNAMLKEIDGSYDWVVRFVKPLTPAEYSCRLNANGDIVTTDIKLGEDAVGASLDQDKAQAIAEKFLRLHRNVYVPFELDGATKIKRKKRIDHHFLFRVPKYKVGEAKLKVSVDVLGDLPGNVCHYWELPDKWQWERAKRSTRKEIADILSALVAAALSIAGIVWISALFKANKIRWRLSLVLSGLLCVCGTISIVNGLPGIFNSYQSTVPLDTWLAMFGISSALGMFLGWGALALAISVILAGNTEEIKLAFRRTICTFIDVQVEGFPSKAYRQFFLDALILACTVQAVFFGESILKGAVNLALRHEVPLGLAPGSLIGLANQLVSPLQVLVNLSLAVLAAPLVLGLGLATCRLLRLTSYWRFSAAVLFIYAISGLADRYWQDFLVGFIYSLVTLTVVWWATRWALRRNMLALIIWVWLHANYVLATELWRFGRPVFWTDLILSFLLLALPFLYLLWLYLASFTSKSDSIN